MVAAIVGMSAACSDGGGGAAGVTYSGATTAAAVTSSNAVVIASTAYQGGNSSGSLTLVGVAVSPADQSGGGLSPVPAVAISRVLTDAVSAAHLGSPASSPAIVGASVSVSDTLPDGNCGGTASYSGTADDVTGAISATFSFNNWCNDGVTISGSVTVSGEVDVSGSTPVLVSLTFSFTVLTVSDGTDTFTGTGTISLDFGTTPESLTVAMDFSDGSGAVYRVSNFVVAVTPTTGGEDVSLSGRFYHPDYGYGDVVTITPFFVATGDPFPSSGQLVVTGAANSKARLTALSATQFQVEVDADGDDIYETTVGPIDWTSL
jgi:hypothetical protein